MGLVVRNILAFIGWRGLLGIVVAAFLSIQLIAKDHQLDAAASSRDHFESLYHGEQGAHLQTKLNYMFAATKAREADAANKARAEAEQRANNERQKADYENRIARARADYQRLLHLKAAGNPGSAGTAPVPGGSAPGSGASPAPQDNGLSLGERLIATEQAIQLDELIDYVDGLLKVDMEGDKNAGR